MKVVGRIGGELVAIEGRLRESGWALVMPESPDLGTASPPTPTPLVNMMKWVTGTSYVIQCDQAQADFQVYMISLGCTVVRTSIAGMRKTQGVCSLLIRRGLSGM